MRLCVKRCQARQLATRSTARRDRAESSTGLDIVTLRRYDKTGIRVRDLALAEPERNQEYTKSTAHPPPRRRYRSRTRYGYETRGGAPYRLGTLFTWHASDVTTPRTAPQAQPHHRYY